MKTITVQQLKARLDNEEKINLIDCREPAEYDEYNIGGKLLPLGHIQNAETNDIDDLKNDEVIIHCRSGKRSAMACQLLESMGFTNTVNVTGGVLAWKDAFQD